MNEQAPLPEPKPIKDLLTPEIHPVTGDYRDSGRATEAADVVLDREVQALEELVVDDLTDGRQHPKSEEGLQLSGDTMRAAVDARAEQMHRDGMLPPE